MNSQNQLLKHYILRSAVALLRSECYAGGQLDALAEVEFTVPRFSDRDTLSLLSGEEFYRLGICPVPTRTTNRLVCERLAKTYSDLSVAGIFRNDDGWLIDIDFLPNGFLLPVRTKRKLIYGFLVYRYPGDLRPFYLKKREVVYA